MTVSILVVDDEADVAELFRQRFRREVRQGLYVLHFAYSGEAALTMLGEGIRPELIVILSDINMPGMDGLTLLGEIKGRWPELAVMMVTAYGDDERRRMAVERGAAKFLAKPVDFDYLKQQLLQLPSASRAQGTMTGPAKILAVDDEPDFEGLLKQRFRRHIRSNEYAFRFAHHGEEALSVLAEDPEIELLLLDINMPVMDGLTLLSILQQRQIPVRAIIVSAYGDMANIRTAMNRGAFDFVTKPVDLNDLEITVRKTLDEIARVRELDRRRAAAERARSNLARYFSPNLAGLLAERDEPLGPVRRETVAVLFADIVGFTRMAEGMAPDAVVGMLREFHEHMASEIFTCGGTIDKYIGDAILAVFGLPTPGPSDAAQALCCAGRMLQALDRWNAQRSARGEPALAIGIGINFGPAVLGDVGSDQGLSFTVIGDTVNIAHRLQGLTRTLQTPLVVADALIANLDGGRTEEVERLLGRLRDQGEQVLRGRSTPVRVWINMQ